MLENPLLGVKPSDSLSPFLEFLRAMFELIETWKFDYNFDAKLEFN